MTHEMTRTAFYNDGTHRFECQECDAVYLLNREGIDKLIKGDQMALHRGGVGGVSIGDITVEQTKP